MPPNPPFLRPGIGPSPAGPPFDFVPAVQGQVSPSNLTPPPRFAVGDRVKDVVASLNSTTVTIAKTNPAGFNNFRDGVGDGNSTFYVLQDSAGNWEANYGVYADVAGTLTRAAVPLASNTSPGQQAAFSGQVTIFGNWPAAAEMNAAYGLASGQFIGPLNRTLQGAATYTAAQNNNFVFYTPFLLPTAFSAVQFQWSWGSSAIGAFNADIGLYSNWNGAPYKLVAAQTRIFPTVNQTILSSVLACAPSAPGLYWAGICMRGLPPSGSSSGMGISALTNPSTDVLGVSSLNNALNGYYESGASLPLIASQSPISGVNGSFPIFPCCLVRPVL